jgi:hypothetical protein
VFPNALRKVGALGRGAAGPVFLHVGTTFVEPTGAAYEPTEGATTDPYPPSPGACASANVLERVKAVVANVIVLSFMRCLSCCFSQGIKRAISLVVPLNFLKRDGTRQAVHISQSLDAPAIVFHRVSFDSYVVGFR